MIKTIGVIFVLVALCVFSAQALAVGDDGQQQGKSDDSQKKLNKLQQLLAQSSVGVPAPIVATNAALDQQQDASNLAPDAAKSETPRSQPLSSEVKPSTTDQAFDSMISQMLPMTPDQIAKLREVFSASQRAAANPPGVPPKPTSTSMLVDLAPQATPPVIRLGAGYITSVVFVDSTGQPWPIAAYSIGDPGAFNIQWDKKGNTLLVQSSSFYNSTNLAVILRDLNTPVMITLLSGQEAVEYRIDLRIPGIGPNAAFVQSGIPDAADPILLDVLNGIPPKGSKELKISGGNCQGWLLENKLFLRTNLDIVSPAWQSIMSSIDGTHAYELQPSPVVLAMQHGKDKVLTITVEGLE